MRRRFRHDMVIGRMGESNDASALLDSAFQAETDRLTRTTVREGNAVTFMPRGEQSYERRWQLIQDAKSTVHLVTFSVINDDTSRRLADVVAEKVRQGVEVAMVCDDAALYTTRSRGILNRMRSAGAEVICYDPPFRHLGIDVRRRHKFRQLLNRARCQFKRRFHEKYLVVDGAYAVLGGMNWGTKYAVGTEDPAGWRDSDCYLTGPVVADVQRRFLGSLLYYRAREEEWRRRRERGFDPRAVFERAIEETSLIEERRPECFPPLVPTGGMALRYVGHKPYDEEELPLTNAFVQAIRAARRSIWWGCHGVRPPRIFAESLADAAARGVEVRLISNSKASSRSLMGRGLLGWMYWECSNHFRWLIERGIHVHLWQRPGAFHSKNFLVDDHVCAIGSYNIANGSAFHHTESAIFAYGGPLAGQVRRQFEIDFRDCHELTREETRRPWSWADPFRRGLHERNLLVDRALWPSALAADLDAGRFKWKYGVAPDW
jgi:phosphatidylserine/phosphatidylglycerophosphate/cardiolipin synthase-like enzyme